MEKSIESIWKEGFLKSDVLVAPKVNDIYNKKSAHIVDKFTRMFKINLVAIVGSSFFVLIMSIISGIPYMGIGLFILLNTIVVINKGLMKRLAKIDKNADSFQYLKTFDGWMKEQIGVNQRLSHLLYPLIFLSLVMGYWFGSFGGDIPGQLMVNELMVRDPETILFLGVPLYLWLSGIAMIALLGYFGGKIYRWDLNIVYGRVLKKLEEIISDMEELRA
jgi:hypothetical protein